MRRGPEAEPGSRSPVYVIVCGEDWKQSRAVVSLALLITFIKSVSFSDGLAFFSGQFFKQETHNLASVLLKKVCKNSFVPAFPDTVLDGSF